MTQIEGRRMTGCSAEPWLVITRVDDERAEMLVKHWNERSSIMEYRIKDEGGRMKAACLQCGEPLDESERALGNGRCAICEKTSGLHHGDTEDTENGGDGGDKGTA